MRRSISLKLGKLLPLLIESNTYDRKPEQQEKNLRKLKENPVHPYQTCSDISNKPKDKG